MTSTVGSLTEASASGRVLRDLVFAERRGFRPLTLDLHLPAALPAPVVVFVHGGGWRLGSRRAFTPGLTDAQSFGLITAAGFAVAAIDYRLSGEALFPAPVDDVVAALAWVRESGAAHGLDPSRVVLWGESAGAHLASLAAFADPDGVRGVIDWYGPADLTTLGRQLDPEHPDAQDDDPESREAGLIGGAVSARLEQARAASPALQVPAGAPPFLVAHGTADTAVPFAQSEAFAAALRAAGGQVELVPVPGADHFWRGVDDTAGLFATALDFAERVTSA